MLRVRVEPGIPKLLVKVNPAEAEAFAAKNLGEVTLRKVASLRGQIAVLHLSRSIPPGEVLMSVKLADLLDVEDDECIEISTAPAASSPIRAPRGAAGVSASGFDSVFGDLDKPGPAGDTRPRYSTAWAPAAGLAPPRLGSKDRTSNFDSDWLRSLEKDGAPRPHRDRGLGPEPLFGRRESGEPDHYGGQATWQGAAAHGRASFDAGPDAPRAGGNFSATPEWLRGLRSYAEKYEQDVARDVAGLRGLDAAGRYGGLDRDRGYLDLDRDLGGPFREADLGAAAFREATPGGGLLGSPLDLGVDGGGGLGGRGLGLSSDRDRLGGWPRAAGDTAAGLGLDPEGEGEGGLGGAWRAGVERGLVAEPLYRRAAGQLWEEPRRSPRRDDWLDEGLMNAGSQSAAECGRAAPEPAPPPTDSGIPAWQASIANWRVATDRPLEEHIWDRPRLPVAESLGPSPTPSHRTSTPGSNASSRASSPRSWLPPPPGSGPLGSGPDGGLLGGGLGGLGGLGGGLLGDCALPARFLSGLSDLDTDMDTALPPLSKTQASHGSSQAASSAPSTSHTPRACSSPTSSPSEGEGADRCPPIDPLPRRRRAADGLGADRFAPTLQATDSLPLALVPFPGTPGTPNGGGATPSTRRAGGVLRRKSSTLGALQSEQLTLLKPEERRPVPEHWRPPVDTGCGGLERSELGNESTLEVRRWLMLETSGPQCSQVILDRALTVLSNFKLASGCQLEVLGGPLGAIVGGYSDADWLLEEVFSRQPEDAIRDSFALLGFRERGDGDWSCIAADEVSLAYRRMCLRGHPSRGGSPRAYLKMQVALELVRAFAGEAGPLSLMPAVDGFVLNDVELVRALQLTTQQAEEEAAKLQREELEEMNRALDEYILRQMCFKSEIVDEIARLHENSAYAILGVSSDATDAELKKAYKIMAMQCHPDKGGDKEEFQELNNAYERIMEQRRAIGDEKKGFEDDDEEDNVTEPSPKKSPKRSPKKEKEEEGEEGTDSPDNDSVNSGASPCRGSAPDGADAEASAEEASDAQLVEKAGKAAEEASRYAKTAAEFAHQAAEAADAARRDQESGTRDSLTKSTAHSAIVYTLTVVKAVRAVGYATLDVAAQCRIAAKRNPEAPGCTEKAVTAMSLGLDALNAALACAEVTESTAAELQRPAGQRGEAEGDDEEHSSARFVGAATRASLAAAGASNAAMSAAIAAVEGSRECMKAMDAVGQRRRAAGKASGGEAGADGEGELEGEEEGEEAESGDEDKPRRKVPTPAEAAAAAAQRLVAQRNNNHKVLRRLNAEILGHQRNVRQFLQANRQLIPDVSGEEKNKMIRLLRDYTREACAELLTGQLCRRADEEQPGAGFAAAIQELGLFVPFLQPQSLAIPVSVKARVLKMAALYDFPLTMRVLDEEFFDIAFSSLLEGDPEARCALEELRGKVKEELSNNVAEAAPEGVTAETPAESP